MNFIISVKERPLFCRCLDSFVCIVATRRIRNRVKALSWRHREENWDPDIIMVHSCDAQAPSCEELLSTIEEERAVLNLMVNTENLNLFIDSEMLMGILKKLPQKLLRPIVMGIGFGLDNGTIAEAMGISKGTARTYKSMALRMAKGKAAENGKT